MIPFNTLELILSRHNGPVWQLAWAHPKFGNVLASCGFDKKVLSFFMEASWV